MTDLILLPDLLKAYLVPVFERKPKSVTAIDVSKRTSYTDSLIIVEAGSRRQVTAIAEHIVTRLKNTKVRALGTEGISEGEWALLDYGNLIIHVFESEIRSYYNLEGLWADAPRYDLSGFETREEKKEEMDAEN